MPCSPSLSLSLHLSLSALVRMSASQNFIILQNEGLGFLSWNWLIAKSTRSQRPFPSYRQSQRERAKKFPLDLAVAQSLHLLPRLSAWYVGRRVYVKCKFEQLKHFACFLIKLSLGKKIVQFRAGIKTKWSCLQEEREEGGRIDKLNTKYRSECSRAK